MHREIKFRGLRTDGKGWVNGDLINVFDAETGKRSPNIVISYNHDTFDWVQVHPDTVGQFTGLFDKNLNEIYEGDLLKRVISFGGSQNSFFEKVIFDAGCYCTISVSDNNDSPLYLSTYVGHSIEVIGNIHEKGVQYA